MKLIIIEDSVYKISEKLYKEIKQKEDEILNVKWYPSQQSDMDYYLTSAKPRMKFLGPVSFDFRL